MSHSETYLEQPRTSHPPRRPHQVCWPQHPDRMARPARKLRESVHHHAGRARRQNPGVAPSRTGRPTRSCRSFWRSPTILDRFCLRDPSRSCARRPIADSRHGSRCLHPHGPQVLDEYLQGRAALAPRARAAACQCRAPRPSPLPVRPVVQIDDHCSRRGPITRAPMRWSDLSLPEGVTATTALHPASARPISLSDGPDGYPSWQTQRKLPCSRLSLRRPSFSSSRRDLAAVATKRSILGVIGYLGARDRDTEIVGPSDPGCAPPTCPPSGSSVDRLCHEYLSARGNCGVSCERLRGGSHRAQ